MASTSAGRLAAALGSGDSTVSTEEPRDEETRLAALVRSGLPEDFRRADVAEVLAAMGHADVKLQGRVYRRLKGRPAAPGAEAEPEPSTTSAGRLAAALGRAEEAPEAEVEPEPRFRSVNGGVTTGSRGKHGGPHGAGEPEAPLSSAEQHAARIYEDSPDRLHRARFGSEG